MKRLSLSDVLVLGVVFVATGCPPVGPPQPPPGWVPAEIQSLVVSPDPVEADSPFTLSVDAVDDHEVHGILVLFRQPEGTYSSGVSCALGDQVSTNQVVLDDPQPAVSLEFTCEFPADAPGGTWQVEMRALDSAGPFNQVPRVVESFEVTGGI